MNELQTRGSGLSVDLVTGFTDSYTAHARDFVAWCHDRGHTEIYDDVVREYFVHLNQSGYKAGTVRIKRAAIKKRIRQLLEHAPLDAQMRLDRVLSNLDKFGDTRAPKVASRAIRPEKVINEIDRAALVAAAKPRLALIMEFLRTTGCRVAELTGVRLSDCTVENGIVSIRLLGKGSKERYVMIDEPDYQEIRDFYQGSEFLFETQNGNAYDNSYISKQIRRLGLRVLGRSISAHTYRHTFATHMIRTTGNLKGVSEYLGHSSIAITADMYDHNLLSTDELLGRSLISTVKTTNLDTESSRRREESVLTDEDRENLKQLPSQKDAWEHLAHVGSRVAV